MPLAALLLVIASFALIGYATGKPGFLSRLNCTYILCDSATIAVAALGMMLIIAVGGIDLSAGAILGLATAVLAYALKQSFVAGQTHPAWYIPVLCILLALGVGSLAGIVNGSLVNIFRVSPFIITLGALTIYQGLAALLSAESNIVPKPSTIPSWLKVFISPDQFRWLGDGGVLAWLPWKVPLGIVVELLLAIGLAVLVKRTIFGRHMIAVGSNEQAARLSGIRVGWFRVMIYALGGGCFGLAGVYQFAHVLNYAPNTGIGRELDIIAAVVIGGGSLKGGRATVLGTLVGSLLMPTIRSGCSLLSIPNPYQFIIIGVIIIGAVLFDRVTGRTE
jgi:ribose/xylose/arabinose/galactoside ABC-type transport system permease subunit